MTRAPKKPQPEHSERLVKIRCTAEDARKLTELSSALHMDEPDTLHWLIDHIHGPIVSPDQLTDT